MTLRIGNGPSSDPFWWSLHQADLSNEQSRRDGRLPIGPASYDPKTPTWALLGKERPTFTDEPVAKPRKKRRKKARARS